jgi:hypothetical protein
VRASRYYVDREGQHELPLMLQGRDLEKGSVIDTRGLNDRDYDEVKRALSGLGVATERVGDGLLTVTGPPRKNDAELAPQTLEIPTP